MQITADNLLVSVIPSLKYNFACKPTFFQVVVVHFYVVGTNRSFDFATSMSHRRNTFSPLDDHFHLLECFRKIKSDFLHNITTCNQGRLKGFSFISREMCRPQDPTQLIKIVPNEKRQCVDNHTEIDLNQSKNKFLRNVDC